jgi:cytochrome P450
MSDRVAALPGLPLVGHLLHFRRDRLGLHRRAAQAGGLTRCTLGRRPMWIMSSAELAHEILVVHDDAFSKAPGLGVFARPILGNGLLTAEKDDHRRLRRLLASAFAPKRVAGYGELMVACAERAASRWQPGQIIDIAEEMNKLTLASVGRTLFDADIESEAKVIAGAIKRSMEFMLENLALPLPLDWPLPRNRRMKKAVQELDDVVYRIIAERRARPGDRGDVLSMLIAACDDDGSTLNDQDVRDNIMTFMIAGHETVANSLAWTWYLLTTHRDAYQRVEAEVDAVCGQRPPTVADLARMPYGLMVLEESMRLYPPAYTIGRQAERAIKIGDASLDAGDVVIIAVHEIHARADYWPAPMHFRPERFTEDEKKKRGRMRYLFFGAGPRICIGNHFAMTEAQLMMTRLVQRWHFRLAQSAAVEPEPLITLRPRGGLRVEVQAR